MRWRLLLTGPMSGADNMAMDEALMRRARATAEGVVRVYSWSEPTLSLGRNQRALGVYDPARAAALGVAIVRRATGGRAVLHHREITYSVSAPTRSGEALRGAYNSINDLLVDALRAICVPAVVARVASHTPPPGSAPCFELSTDGELVVEGAKLAGSAQYREDGAFLQHGSILVHDDQPIIARVANRGSVNLPAAATIFSVLGREVTPSEFSVTLFDAVRRRWDGAASELTPDDAIRSWRAEARERFLSPEWTWRR